MLRIESLGIDDHVLEKIESKHGLSFSEVEETCLSDARHVRRGKEDLYKVFTVRRPQGGTFWWSW